MSTPIYKISDRAPEFPCWLWSLLENEWQQREHLIGDVDTLYDFTHWCHSETRPTVTPDAGSKLDALFREIRRAGVYDSEPAPSAPDVQRVAEEIARPEANPPWCGKTFRAKTTHEIAAILTRFAAGLTAEKDTKRLDWRTGTPDVAEGQREVFWCATRNRNGKVFHRHLVYLNKHVMPLSDSCYDVPEGAVPVGDDDEYEWTGWCQESCDHCETQWMFNDEVIAWTRLPKFDAAEGGAK